MYYFKCPKIFCHLGLHKVRELKHKTPARESLINMAIENVENFTTKKVKREGIRQMKLRRKFKHAHSVDFGNKFSNYDTP